MQADKYTDIWIDKNLEEHIKSHLKTHLDKHRDIHIDKHTFKHMNIYQLRQGENITNLIKPSLDFSRATILFSK